MAAQTRLLPLQEAVDVVLSLLRGERSWAWVDQPYEAVTDGDVTFVTADGWTVCLHKSFDELKHTRHILSPDGRRGEAANWTPEATAAGRLWGDPMDVLREAEFDWLEELALRAPPRQTP
jgi:hypothetical protein